MRLEAMPPFEMLLPVLLLSGCILFCPNAQADTVQKSGTETVTGGKASSDDSAKPTSLMDRSFGTQICRTVPARYLLYLPWHYGEKDAKWPLLLYLHGKMGRGDNFDKMSWYPVVKMMLQNDSLPFIVVAPQCPEGQMWTDAEMLISLVQSVCDSFAVDTNRIYMAGFSMGGAGVWNLAYLYPDRFAAIAPMSAPGLRSGSDRFRGVPVWIFHGTADTSVPVSEAEMMIRGLQQAKAEVKTSLVPGRGHVAPSVEEHKELFDWLLEHRRGKIDTSRTR